MKTDKPTRAEEILTVYFKHNNCSDEFIKAEIETFIKCPTCAKALEQYRTEVLRDFAKFFNIKECYPIISGSDVDEYLKQKGLPL